MVSLLAYFRPTPAPAADQRNLQIPTIELRKPSQAAILDKQDSFIGDASRLSAFPAGDFRNSSVEDINDMKCDVIVNWLHSQQEERQWLSGGSREGVMLKKAKGKYACAPKSLEDADSLLFDIVAQLNVRVCMVLLV
jgi:hypothetical protein